jgi:hypothetical protein
MNCLRSKRPCDPVPSEEALIDRWTTADFCGC